MNVQNRPYLNSWIAILLLSIASLVLMVISHLDFGPRWFMLILQLLLWAGILVAGIYLFIKASNADARLSAEKEGSTGRVRHVSRTGKKPVTETHLLDVESTARKIVRSADPGKKTMEWGHALLNALANELEIMSGVVYEQDREKIFRPVAGYAIPVAQEPYAFKEGEGLTGQAAQSNQVTVYRKLPEEYSEVFSGLGGAKPSYLAFAPVAIKGRPPVIIEIAGFRYADAQLEQLLTIVVRDITIKLQEKKDKTDT